MYFYDLRTHLLLMLNNISLSGYITVHLCIHLLKDSCFQALAIMKKLLWLCCIVIAMCTTHCFQAHFCLEPSWAFGSLVSSNPYYREAAVWTAATHGFVLCVNLPQPTFTVTKLMDLISGWGVGV